MEHKQSEAWKPEIIFIFPKGVTDLVEINRLRKVAITSHKITVDAIDKMIRDCK